MNLVYFRNREASVVEMCGWDENGEMTKGKLMQGLVGHLGHYFKG